MSPLPFASLCPVSSFWYILALSLPESERFIILSWWVATVSWFWPTQSLRQLIGNRVAGSLAYQPWIYACNYSSNQWFQWAAQLLFNFSVCHDLEIVWKHCFYYPVTSHHLPLFIYQVWAVDNNVWHNRQWLFVECWIYKMLSFLLKCLHF